MDTSTDETLAESLPADSPFPFEPFEPRGPLLAQRRARFDPPSRKPRTDEIFERIAERVMGGSTDAPVLEPTPVPSAEPTPEEIADVRARAENGLANAQYTLGAMYWFGRGVPLDDAEAGQWYRLAADQGDAQAQYNLGAMYAYGQGVLQDDVQAVAWYRAAEQGLAEAQQKLGLIYVNGKGVPQNESEAMEWFRQAAEQGDAQAQYNVGVMHANSPWQKYVLPMRPSE